MATSGIILCGGKSSRMGANKAFLKVAGERLIDRTLRILTGLFEEVMLVTNTPLEYVDMGVSIVTDIIPGKGALGGIYTGLFYSSSERVFVVPCDMPFLNESFIEYMGDKAGKYDIVVPLTKEGYQPLHAFYSRHCLEKILQLISVGDLKVSSIFEKFKTLKITEKEVRSFDREMKIFFNVNSPEDFRIIA